MAEIFLKLETPDRKRDALASLALLAVLVVFRWRVFENFTTHLVGGSEADAGLYAWLIQSAIDDLFSNPWFTTSAFYPYGESLAWSDNFLLPAALAWPFLKAGAAVPVVWNSLFLAAHFLAGFFCYRLVFLLFASFTPSLVSGLIFLTSPVVSAHAGHPQLQFTFFFPFTAILVFRFLEAPSFLRAVLLSLAGGLAFLCSVYYSVFACLLAFLLLTSAVILRPSSLKARDYGILAAGVLAGSIPLIPFIIPYIHVGEAFGGRALFEAYHFSASLSSFVSASGWSHLYGGTSSFTHDEAHLFAGVVVYLLAGAAVARLFQAKPLRGLYLSVLLSFLLILLCSVPALRFPGIEYVRSLALWFLALSGLLLLYFTGKLEEKLDVRYFTRRDIIASFALAACAAFIISFGPLGFPEAGDASITPYAFFHAFFPGFNSIRAIGRIGVLLHFALVVLAGGGLARIAANPRSTPKIILLLALFALVENNIRTYPLEPLPRKPEIFDELSTLRQKSPLLVLPMTTALRDRRFVRHWSDFAKLNVRYMLWARGSRLDIVNGYSGLRSKIMRELPGEVASFPDAKSLESIRKIHGLRFLIYMPELVPDFDEAAFEAAYQKTPGRRKLSL